MIKMLRQAQHDTALYWAEYLISSAEVFLF